VSIAEVYELKNFTTALKRLDLRNPGLGTLDVFGERPLRDVVRCAWCAACACKDDAQPGAPYRAEMPAFQVMWPLGGEKGPLNTKYCS
jgi:hypothetical protein